MPSTLSVSLSHRLSLSLVLFDHHSSCLIVSPKYRLIHTCHSSSRVAYYYDLPALIYLFINHLQENIKKHTLASLKYMQLVDCKSGHYHC